MKRGNTVVQLLDSVSPCLSLVPVPGLHMAWKGFKSLWDLVQQVRCVNRVALYAPSQCECQVHEGRSQLEVLSGSVAVFLRALDRKLRDNDNLDVSIELERDLDPLLR